MQFALLTISLAAVAFSGGLASSNHGLVAFASATTTDILAVPPLTTSSGEADSPISAVVRVLRIIELHLADPSIGKSPFQFSAGQSLFLTPQQPVGESSGVGAEAVAASRFASQTAADAAQQRDAIASGLLTSLLTGNAAAPTAAGVGAALGNTVGTVGNTLGSVLNLVLPGVGLGNAVSGLTNVLGSTVGGVVGAVENVVGGVPLVGGTVGGVLGTTGNVLNSVNSIAASATGNLINVLNVVSASVLAHNVAAVGTATPAVAVTIDGVPYMSSTITPSRIYNVYLRGTTSTATVSIVGGAIGGVLGGALNIGTAASLARQVRVQANVTTSARVLKSSTAMQVTGGIATVSANVLSLINAVTGLTGSAIIGNTVTLQLTDAAQGTLLARLSAVMGKTNVDVAIPTQTWVCNP